MYNSLFFFSFSTEIYQTLQTRFSSRCSFEEHSFRHSFRHTPFRSSKGLIEHRASIMHIRFQTDYLILLLLFFNRNLRSSSNSSRCSFEEHSFRKLHRLFNTFTSLFAYLSSIDRIIPFSSRMQTLEH